MKMDSDPPIGESPLVTCGEKPQDETKILPPAVIARYYGVMDDEGADAVFIPLPSPYVAPSLPAEGSTDAQVNNSSVTLTNGPADATEAKDNPGGLDWHLGEKQLMAAQSEADEVITSTAQESKESMDTVSLSRDKDATQDQDQTSMEENCYDPSGNHHQDETTGDKELSEPEDIEILSEGQEKCWETDVEKDKYSKGGPSSIEENSENDTHFDKEGESEDTCHLETDLKLITVSVDCGDVETNTQTDFESNGAPELCKGNQSTKDAATYQPQVQEISTEVSNDDKEQVDSKSLNYTLTKHNWERRESGTNETQLSRSSISEGSERLSTDIQQGEQLLQRLQQLQLRQDVCRPEGLHTSQKVVKETRGETSGDLGAELDDLKAREADRTGGDEEEESGFDSVEDGGSEMILEEKKKNESKEAEAKAWMSPNTMPESEHHMTAREELKDSDDDQTDSWVPAGSSQIDPNETPSNQIPFVATCHRLSVAETCSEKQIHEEAQGTQNLQRADGVFNLTDNPDVLEIPFKTSILLEPLPAKDGPDQPSDWQFSEQKMKKEISQEIQRELVLVNLGKIPGGYSKGEVRQLKETKLLFEAFQQDNTEGPTRHRKAPLKGHVYPSVLERTRSLEMLSLKSCYVSRAHSLRLVKDTEKSPELFRSTSPNGGSLDKARLSPFTKQDKHGRLSRSMDSISTDVSTAAVDARSKTRVGNATQESAILKGNPFFKLRPALALQPEVEKDIREAREREEELRRQRSTLYGENRRGSGDGDKSRFNPILAPDVRKQSRGKLERVWPPPPSKKDQMKSEQTQQEPKLQRAGGQKTPLWQRWESGLINGKPSNQKN